MLPEINGKSLLEINKDDLSVLINNPDYRESEYIDYKRNFAFLELKKDSTEYKDKIIEFKNDVCSFANSEGGYLIFGISDNKGIAESIIGVNISDDNTDRFELERRNDLMSISPKTPLLKFLFIKIGNSKYVVVIYIKSDNYAPYLHLKNQQSYYAYTRSGNGKRYMTYNELKNKFNQSIRLEKEIYNYRLERINFFKDKLATNENKFFLIQFIPETFIDSSYNINPFVLKQVKNVDFSDIFYTLHCGNIYVPCVEGLHFISSPESGYKNEGLIANNGVVECFCPLVQGDLLNAKNYFYWGYLWPKIETMFTRYVEVFKNIFSNRKIFIGISIVNCKNVLVSDNYNDVIDRDLIVSNPIVLNDIVNDKEYEVVKKQLYIEFLLSLGIKREEKLLEILEELYG